MAYDPEELVPFKGRMTTAEALFNKVRGLGWNHQTFGALTHDQMVEVFEQRKTPDQMGVKPPTEPQPIDVNAAGGDDPSIMGNAPPSEDNAPVRTPAPPQPPSNKYLKPIDPTRPAQAPTERRLDLTPSTAPLPVVPRPPKTDTERLMSMIGAAFELSRQEATIPTAKTLIQANGLERAFQAMYPELSKAVLGRFDVTPDPKCRGGVILDIEYEDGYAHIITSVGLITLTADNLKAKA